LCLVLKFGVPKFTVATLYHFVCVW
jgi:hypothetical protein